jgi:hypothetical protein
MSRIKSGWTRYGHMLADFVLLWVFASLFIAAVIVLLCLMLIIAMGGAGFFGGGLAGMGQGIGEAVEIILEVMVGSWEIIAWLLAIWFGILLLGLLIFAGTFIFDLFRNVWDNLFTPGVNTWREFWSDLWNNSVYVWDGIKEADRSWRARIKAKAEEGWSLVKKGVGWGIDWLKRKTGWWN